MSWCLGHLVELAGTESEKPSVGAAYAALLGAKKRMDGYWEGNGYLV